MMKTLFAAVLSTTLAGALLFWAAGSGAGAEPTAKSEEVATLDGNDAQARTDDMKQRMAATRARLDELRAAKQSPEPKQPKQPKPRRQPPPQDPEEGPGVIHIDPSCLAGPLCAKHE